LVLKYTIWQPCLPSEPRKTNGQERFLPLYNKNPFGSEFSLIGLALIALGTGGIKPCVAAFGGDQFKLPEQERQLQVPIQ
jgi:dipeptide/tripeptide permease